MCLKRNEKVAITQKKLG